MQVPRAALSLRVKLFSRWRPLSSWYLSLFCSSTGGTLLTRLLPTRLPVLYVIVCVFPLYILNYKRIVLLVFRSFLKRVVLCVAVVLMCPWKEVSSGSSCLPGAGERHSTRDKGREEGGSAYAKAGSSLGSPPGYSQASTPKTRVCLLYCFVLSPLTWLGTVPYHHLALSVKELTYSSN